MLHRTHIWFLSLLWLFTALAVLPGWTVRGADSEPLPDNRATLQLREQMLERFEQQPETCVKSFTAALDHESALIRRTAAHLLVRLGRPALDGIEKGLQSPDFQVRRIMMQGLSELGLLPDYWPVILQDAHPSIRSDVHLIYMEDYPLPEGAAFDAIIGRLAEAYSGGSPAARIHVVETIAQLPLTEAGQNLLIQAAADPDDAIRETAIRAIQTIITLDWPRGDEVIAAAEADDVRAIREIGFAMRVELLAVQDIPLPTTGWRFATDPDDQGEEDGWYKPAFDDSNWRSDGRIETAWEPFLGEFYIGNGWYRRDIDVPAVAGWDRAVLHFGGVDENGWAWLDGQALGEHAIGPFGWDMPFSFEVTEWIRPGERQQVTIRARNSIGNGGVWRPVRLIFLRDWPRGPGQ